MKKSIDINEKICNATIIYMVIMLVAVAISTFTEIGISVCWIANFIGGVLILFGNIKNVSWKWLLFSIIYVLAATVTLLYSIKYGIKSIKAIGTNINILAVPLFICYFDWINRCCRFTANHLFKLLKIISGIGLLMVFLSWFFGYQDIIAALMGRIGAYQAKAAGIFYNKNIYGIFVSLTLCADIALYMIEKKGTYRRIAICAIKYLAVVLSFSRAALLQVTIAIATFFWFQKKRSKKEWAMLIIGVIAIGVVTSHNQNVLTFIQQQVIRENVGDAGRADLIKQAFQMFPNDVLTYMIGVGFAGLDKLLLDIDNTYCYLLFSGGILKCFMYLLLAVHSVLKILKLRIYQKILGDICLSVFISYLVFACFESVALYELGIANFMFMLFICFIPNCIKNVVKEI